MYICVDITLLFPITWFTLCLFLNAHALTSLCLVRNKLDVSRCPPPHPTPPMLACVDREVCTLHLKLQHWSGLSQSTRSAPPSTATCVLISLRLCWLFHVIKNRATLVIPFLKKKKRKQIPKRENKKYIYRIFLYNKIKSNSK